MVKPAAEMSKDFFRNMRDLQNSMDDFSTLHDLLAANVAPLTNFSDEALSSAIFLLLTLAALALFLAAHLLPWRLLALVAGWSALALGHPRIHRLATQTLYPDHVRPASAAAKRQLDTWIATDLALDSSPETREVEVYELQRRPGHNTFAAGEWEPWAFSASAWEPLAPARVAGERARGARLFEDVCAPPGWEWAGKKWELDLGSREWVEERVVVGVEVELEGERWVYDVVGGGGEGEGEGEGDAGEDGLGRRRGEWRRRRWVRMVRRKAVRRAGGKT
jgi:hypothetical protein